MLTALTIATLLVLGCCGIALLEWGLGAALDYRRDRLRQRGGLDISNLH